MKDVAVTVKVKIPEVLAHIIPEGATIKQVAITIRGLRMYAVFMLDLAAEAQSVSYGRVARIKRHRATAQTQVEVPVDDEDGTARPSPENLKCRQCCNDEPERKPVAEPHRKIDLSSPTHQSVTIDEAREVGNCDVVECLCLCPFSPRPEFEEKRKEAGGDIWQYRCSETLMSGECLSRGRTSCRLPTKTKRRIK